MGILEIIKKRRSVRNFKIKEIPKNIEKKLIEALIWAPSAGNLQSRKFYFVKDIKKKEALVKAALSQNFISLAPLVVVGCLDLRIEKNYGERGKELYAICDVSASIENMMLEAAELGLGTCWVGAFDEKEVVEALDIPNYLRPIVILPVGYPDYIPPPTDRKSEEELIVHK